MDLLCGGCETLGACSERRVLKKNGISELTDDILLCILSSLTMKESGRTSMLSKRWRHLWSYLPTLNFDSCNISHEISVAQKEVEVKRSRHKLVEPDVDTYVDWVDQVLNSHSGHIIDEFRVQCHLNEHWGQHAVDWVKFAMGKRVKRLAIDLSQTHGFQQLSWAFSISSFCNLLTSLELCSVNVTGEVLEILLHTCQLLEFLFVKDSKSLVSMKVVGLSLKLKYLILYYCYEMKHLEISAPNLVYFCYHGHKIDVPFKWTPKLTEIYLGGRYTMNMTNNITEHSNYLYQLEALSLCFHCSAEFIMQCDQFPELTKLKKLVVRHFAQSIEYLTGFRSFIKACPCLKKFIYEVWTPGDCSYNTNPCREWIIYPHHYLKMVEVVGFDGNVTSYEFTIYLLDSAVSLENITIDPRDLFKIGLKEFHSCKMKRTMARRLAEYLKPGTDLVIR